MFDLSPLWISLKTATTATAIALLLGIAAARWMLGDRCTNLTQSSPAKKLLDNLLTLPLVLPPTVLGFLLLLLLGKQGPLGRLLQVLDLTVIFSWPATVIAATAVAFPLIYKTALGAFRQLDPNLLAGARTLGASEWTIFWRIMIPLARPGLLAGTLLAFARAWGEFGATVMLAGSIPGKTQTIPIAIFFAAESGAMDRAFAWVAVMVVVALGIVTAVNCGFEGRSRPVAAKQRKWVRRLAQALRPKIKGLRSRREKFPNSPSGQPIELTVEIQKQLPHFSLDISFQTDQTPLGLLGASGAGKSTILRCIAGLETPDRGRIVLNGRALFDSVRGINLPPRDRRVGYLFQNYALFPHLTVAENIAFGMPRGLSSVAVRQCIASDLAQMDLQGLEKRYPGELSGGQQQRVALARTLAREPEILLLDEPFSALDTYLRDRLEKLLRATLNHYSGATLFVTHNLEEAYRICPNLLAIDGGRILDRGSKQKIFEHPATLRVAQITGCKNFSRAVALNAQQAIALDWGCTLTTLEPLPNSLARIGIRAHQLAFRDRPNSENTFPCWLAAASETQHRITLYLKLQSAPTSPQDYHLQAEVFKDKWETLKARPYPWHVQLHPLRLILLPASRE